MPVWLLKALILRGLSLNDDFVSKYSISIFVCLTKWWLLMASKGELVKVVLK